MRDWMIPALLITILLLFGSRKLPDMARSLGQSLRILKSETKAMGDERPAGTVAPAVDPGARAADPAQLPRAAEPADGRPNITHGHHGTG
jgi:sec-independent protein translocase protein TatA